jgi:hypothetical protein
MNKFFPWLNKRPKLFYLILFLLMIIPGLILFPAAQGDSGIGMAFLLGLVILANVAAVLQ